MRSRALTRGWFTPVVAGAAYFALVFAAGFALGALRVLVLEPALGAFWAVALELPVMLAVAWAACAVIVRRLGVTASLSARITMGAMAFVCLMTAEVVLSTTAFGRSPVEFVAGWLTPAGLLGLGGQIGFAAIPVARLLGARGGRDVRL